jgi:CDP-glucose 4,6-dehydratase
MENMVANSALIKQTYKGKKVFLTGHTGFKGSWMLLWLHSMGAIVKGYALAPQHPADIYHSLPCDATQLSLLGDIRNKQLLAQEIQNFEPDFIFHLAAQPLVRYSYQQPAETFDVNVTGTANVLEAATKLTNKCSIVVITTDKVYHNIEQHHPYVETDRLGGYDPYSASKACAELVVDSFRNSFFSHTNSPISLASARAGNVIGGGDWNANRIVPDMVNALQNNQPIPLRNPNAIRPWQHVLEPVEGYLLLAAKLHSQPTQYAKAYNFGPSPAQYYTVKELVQDAINSWGQGHWVDASTPNQPHEAGILTLDIALAKNELDWQPKLTQLQAIDWTMAWYKTYLQTNTSIALQQIKQYETI